MAMNPGEFYLRCELRGHSEDVRSLCIRDDGAIVTASRDKTLMVWSEDNSSSGLGRFKQRDVLAGHSNYVTCAAWVPASLSRSLTDGAVVSGSRDNSVIVWDMKTCSPKLVLEGHTYQVTDVAIGEGGAVVSCALDKTLRVWDVATGESSTLVGHEGPVLCCVVLSSGDILSGSGDTTVRRWSGGKCVNTIKAHSDSVRGIVEFPGVGFVTASHDQTLKVWTSQGECIAEMLGHQALVYAVAILDGAFVVSGSEDRTCKLWQPDGTCIQTIEHPSCVWDVAVLPNRDIVTACGDHQAYVWTTSTERKADTDLVSTFAGSLPSGASGSGTKSDAALPGGLKMEPPEALLVPGKSGQTKIISEGGAGVAYTWDESDARWEKIGEVVGGPSGGDSNMAVGSKFHNGQEWDYVFDVDVADGMPPLKLAINRGDNPYEVADTFLAQYELPASYKDQIVQFILQNTGGDVSMPASNPDPYTGGGAYIPLGSGYPSTNSAQGAVTGGGADPYTGGASQPTALQHCPLKSYLTWLSKLSNPTAVANRVRELSASLESAMSDDAAVPLLPEEATPGGALDTLLGNAAKCSFDKGSSNDPFSEADIQLLRKMLAWPASAIYPALDIARLVVLAPEGAAKLAVDAGELLPSDGGQLGHAVFRALYAGSEATASQQTCLRLLSNCCIQPPTRAWLASQIGSLLDASASAMSSPKAAVQLAYVTMVLNISMMLRNDSGCSVGDRIALKTQALNCMVQLLIDGQGDELIFRALVAVGTLLHEDKAMQVVAKELMILDVVRSAASRGVEGKVSQAMQDVVLIVERGL